jgi:hypothetical protein
VVALKKKSKEVIRTLLNVVVAGSWFYIGQTGRKFKYVGGKNALFCIVWLYFAMFRNVTATYCYGSVEGQGSNKDYVLTNFLNNTVKQRIINCNKNKYILK